MLIVRPLEDELAEAHAYRHQHIEGYESLQEQIRALRSQLGIEKGIGCKYPTTHLLAVIGGKSIDEYVRQHTMLPLTAAVPSIEMRTSASINDWLSSAFHLGFRRPVDDVRICVECLELDRAEGKLSSYWRRHHVKGTSRCPLHGIRLHAIRECLPFSARPDDWITRGQIGLVPDIEADVADPQWMRRYINISMAMLNTDEPLATVEANHRLIEVLEAAGLSTKASQSRPLVSDLLRAKAGKRWVTENLALMRGKQSGDFVPLIDGLAYNPANSRSSILHAALWACFADGDPWTNRVQSKHTAQTIASRATETGATSAV
jgi:hypothetical protein